MRVDTFGRRRKSAARLWLPAIGMVLGLLVTLTLILKPDFIAKPFDVFGTWFAPFGMTRLMRSYQGGMMQVAPAPDGRVYVVDKNQIQRYVTDAAGIGDAAVIYDGQILRAQLPGLQLEALSRVTVGPQGEVYAATWYGRVLRFENEKWQRIAAPELDGDGATAAGAYPRTRVNDLCALDRETLLIGSRGLWVLDLGPGDGAVPQPVAGIATDAIVNRLAPTPGGAILVASSKGLYAMGMRHGETTDSAWAGSDLAPGEVRLIRPAAELGGALVAVAVGADGIVTASYDTVCVLARDGSLRRADRVATALEDLSVAPDGSILAACRKTGLHLLGPGADATWRTLPFTTGLDCAVVAPDGRLWVTLYDQAAMCGDFVEAGTHALPHAGVSSRPTPGLGDAEDSAEAAP